MEGRGLKRNEEIDELPADKRACSSLESRPSTLNTPMGSKASTRRVRDTDMESRPSTLNTPMGSSASTHEVRDTDMDSRRSTLTIPMDSTASTHEVRDTDMEPSSTLNIPTDSAVSTHEVPDTDMDESSLASGSIRSESDGDRSSLASGLTRSEGDGERLSLASGLTRSEGDGERSSLASGLTRSEGDGERPSLASGLTRSEGEGERSSLASGLTRSEGDGERSSLASGSTRSEGDGERDSTHSSYESDNSLRDHYYSHQSSGEDLPKINKVLSSLSEEVDESGQLAVLTELCELLSFSSDSSFSSQMADSFSPLLVTMANHETKAEIMLLSIRAITYLCDLNPRSAGFLVRHDAVPVLCQRLMAIEYLDVAEQCLQALEKISREQPLACLQSGAIMAVLGYIEFFSTSVQRVALSTVANICKKLSADSPSFFIDAIPILCNLLQNEDKQLVESVATCLIRIGKQIQASSELLDRICNDGLVQRTLQLIGSNSRMTLCQSTHIGLIGLLVMLVSGSTIAFKTLFEHNISNTVKDMLSTYHLSNGIQSTPMVDGHHSQLTLEVIKLLNELLPTIAPEKDGQPKPDKETFLLNRPDIVQKFGVDLLPILVQVVNSGVNLFICYGCLSVINKLIHFSIAGMLHSLLQTANISSFLAGVFTRKDHHLTFLALQIVDSVMLKLPNVFLSSFIKEGVLFAISTELSPNNGSKISPVFYDMGLEKGGTKKSASQDIRRCPCFSFDACQSSKGSENETCKLHKDTVHNLAKHVWMTYFEAESMNPEKGVTDTLRKLRTLSNTLVTRVNKSLKDIYSSQDEEEIYEVLYQIMSNLNEKDTISNFEFVESGVIKALVTYLSNGNHLVGEENKVATMNLCIMEKRFEVFGRLLWSCTVPSCEELPLVTLIRRLQSALSSVENFNIISSHKLKMKSYATVPFGRQTSYPCLAVQFVREIDDNSLRDYIEDAVSVDPLLPLGEIEGYLWPRVSNGKTKNPDICSEYSKEKDTSSDCTTSLGGTPDSTVASAMEDVHQVQEENSDLLLSSPSETSRVEQKDLEADVTDVHTDRVEEKEHSSLQVNDDMDKDQVGAEGSEDTKPKLLFYWEGQQLNNKFTLYQSIVEQQAEAEHDNSISQSSWTRVYKITYRRPVTTQSSNAKYCHNETQCPLLSLMFVSEVDLEKLGPTYDILFLLKSLEEINRLRFHLISRERTYAFAEGRTDNLDKLNIPVYEICQNEFINSKLTEKLEQQMRDPMSVSVGGMPVWCTQLLHWCPFLFGYKARQKYFNLAALGRLPAESHTSSDSNSGGSSRRHQNRGNTRKKFLVHRNRILESAAKMMEHHSSQKVIFEVEYIEEVGTGLGPTLEFYTLVSHEFQRSCLGMWRDNNHVLEAESSEFLMSPFGLFPRPWSPLVTTSKYSEVIEKFVLLGQIVAKALQDGRILDLPFSKAFYKLILGKALTLSDIQSIDPAFGRTLLEFQGVIERKRYLQSHCEEKSHELEVCFRSTRIEDLCLDFTLPGYPDYVLVSASDPKMVNLCNLEEYVTLMVDATTKSGISGQVEAFKLGFNQVFPIRHLKVFTEEELERLLCGEHILWNSDELMDHIKFDHGYTIRSPPIENLLEIMQELDREQQRAFMQFVTGAPRLPPGGLASLNPKLTIVRKHCSESIDVELPSVMTCANYLKLPPYSSKNIMKEKLLYAITEGQGSFHLS